MTSTPSSRGRTPPSGRWSRSIAGAVPAPRSTVDDRPARRTDRRPGPRRAPRRLRHTHTPFIATASASGSNVGVGRADRGQHPAPVRVLAVHRALEQVAARHCPADLDGVVLVGRACDRDRDLLAGALGVGHAAAGPDRRTTAVDRVRRARPAAPACTPERAAGHAGARCRWSTCSRRSRPGRTSRAVAARSAASSVAGAGDRVGGDARPAWSPARAPACRHPWPCRPRRTPAPSHGAGLGHGVGRHDRRCCIGTAVGADELPARRLDARPGARSIGSRSPISPVEQTATSPAPQPSSSATSARRVRAVSAKPSGPVQALAPPEFSTTARSAPVGDDPLGPQHRCSLDPVAREHAGGRVAAARR